MSGQSGARLSRKLMAERERIEAEWPEPIYKLMIEEILESRCAQCNETPVKAIEPNERRQGAAQ